LVVEGLAEKQADARREVVGPTKAVGFDAEGRPTRAAEGFARAQGVPVERLQVRALDRGEYVVAVQEEKGAFTSEVLLALLPKLITSLSFPKLMRWGEGTFRFVRPIRWLLCIYGGKVVPITIEGLKADAKTYGHRFLSPRGVRVRGFQDYLEKLEEKFVIADPDRRRGGLSLSGWRPLLLPGGLGPALPGRLPWSGAARRDPAPRPGIARAAATGPSGHG
jgi:glycyl-tRNA synthetase beta chain